MGRLNLDYLRDPRRIENSGMREVGRKGPGTAGKPVI